MSHNSPPSQSGSEKAAGGAIRKQTGRLSPAIWWVLIALPGVAVFSLAAAHAPARVRLLGLYALVFGLLCGWLLACLARSLNVTNRKAVGVLSFFLIAGGEIGLMLESHRVYAAQIRETYETDIPQMISPGFFQPSDEETRQPVDVPVRLRAAGEAGRSIKQERLRIAAEKSRFSAYLQHRISPLGAWSVTTAVLFWAGEVLLGSAAGALLAVRLAAPCKRLDDGPAVG